ELDLLRDRHTVVRDRGGSPLLLEHDVAAARAERDLDGVSERVEPALQATTGLFVERNHLCHVSLSSLPDVETERLLGTHQSRVLIHSGTLPSRVQTIRAR